MVFMLQMLEKMGFRKAVEGQGDPFRVLTEATQQPDHRSIHGKHLVRSQSVFAPEVTRHEPITCIELGDLYAIIKQVT